MALPPELKGQAVLPLQLEKTLQYRFINEYQRDVPLDHLAQPFSLCP
jgi:hypothetical protein